MDNETRKITLFEKILTVFLSMFLIFVFVGNLIYGADRTRIWLSVPVIVIVWIVLGCGVLAWVDVNQELYEWVWDKAPGGYFSMLAILLFPIVAIVYIRGKRKSGLIEGKFIDDGRKRTSTRMHKSKRR